MPDTPSSHTNRFPAWEWVAIIVAIASLWPAYVIPAITGTPADPVWSYVCYAMLAVMLVVFVRRLVRFHRLAREQEEGRRKRDA